MKSIFLSLFFTMNVFAGVELPASISHIKKNKVLVFISRTCPCTQQNIPYINELVTEFPDIEFIGVHSVKNAGPKMIEEVISEYKPKFTIIDDKDLAIANIMKANRTPQTFILSAANDVLYDGGVTNRTNPKSADKLYLHNALVELTQNKPITEKETRSLGCVILR